MNLKQYIIYMLLTFIVFSCNKDEWIEKEPVDKLSDIQVFSDETLVLGLLGNLYDRLPVQSSLDNGLWTDHAIFDDAMFSGHVFGDYLNDQPTYGWNYFGYYNYGYMKEINYALKKINESDLEKKELFAAELRFIRAYTYFEMVKRMGGVPLITEYYTYESGIDVDEYKFARKNESEIYDFVASEVDDIKNTLLENEGDYSRANYYTALALKCRAMLYAGSIAKYNSTKTPLVTISGTDIVGIPSGLANSYFQKAIDAGQAIIDSNRYELYDVNPDKAANFYDLFSDKTKASNKEVIFVQDFEDGSKTHGWTRENGPPSIEDGTAGAVLTPSLNLVETYDNIDGTNTPLDIWDEIGNDYVYYDNTMDLFANKDPRLAGTIILPGSTFAGKLIEMYVGVKVWDTVNNVYVTREASDLGQTDSLHLIVPSYPKELIAIIGSEGPSEGQSRVTHTGFYMRKFMDQDANAALIGIGSDAWWVRFRLAEIYLNVAEAYFETNNRPLAALNINKVRARAGVEDILPADLTMDDFYKERRCEMAFEDHRIWDLKRWRIAHEVWDGDEANPDAMVYGLYPFKVYNSADPSKDGKYVFEKRIPTKFESARYFRLGNYYSEIPPDAILKNEKLVKNPFH